MQNVGTAHRDSRRGDGSKWKKWLLIYVVAAAVIYAIVYFVFLYHSGGYGGGGGSSGGNGGGGGGYGLIALPLSTLQYLYHRLKR
jgi:hypothetical protein